MICEICKPMAAVTERMWRNRQRNLADYPDVAVYKCGACGGTEWATTRDYIKSPQLGQPYHWRPSATVWLLAGMMLGLWAWIIYKVFL